MRFYHNFYTDLPDQFVEANADKLRGWATKFAGGSYFKHNDHVGAVPIVLIEDRTDRRYPTFRAVRPRMIETWMNRNGDNYNGRYWETLAEDQRSPARAADWGAGKDDTVVTWFSPGQVTWIGSGGSPARTRPGLTVWHPFESEAPKPPLMREMAAGEIVGYRCWRVERQRLVSVYQTDVWQPGERLEGRELDDWDSRGIHAWKSAGSREYHDYIRSYLNMDDSPFSAIIHGRRDGRPAMVTGTVWLWGDVVEHERGYRAEFAKVRSLDWLYPDASMMGREQQTLDQLRQLYSVQAQDA